MGIEIERKFLVDGDAWRDQVTRTRRMVQGYLTDERGRASVRVRIEDDEARLNIKAAVVGAARAEFDYGIPVADAQGILELCVARLEKVRHYVEHEGHLWEIDVFAGDNAGLVVAELELDTADEDFARPPWLGAEVTDERRYYNHQLALHPYRQWTRVQPTRK
jgi:adenylate cyclase